MRCLDCDHSQHRYPIALCAPETEAMLHVNCTSIKKRLLSIQIILLCPETVLTEHGHIRPRPETGFLNRYARSAQAPQAPSPPSGLSHRQAVSTQHPRPPDLLASVHLPWDTFHRSQEVLLVNGVFITRLSCWPSPQACKGVGGMGLGGLRTAAAVSLLSARARSRSLRLSSRLLRFFPLGKGSFTFLCFRFDPKGPMSQRGHSTWRGHSTSASAASDSAHEPGARVAGGTHVSDHPAFYL